MTSSTTSPRPQSPFRGGRAGIDGGHDHALHAVLDLERLARLVAKRRKLHAQRLGDSVRLQRVILVVGERRRLLFSVLEPPQRHRLGDFLAVAHDHDLDLPADRHRSDEARKIARFLDVLAVELDDHVARHQAGRLCRSLLVHAGDQSAARRSEIEAVSDGVVDRLDPHAKPTAPGFPELPQLPDHRLDGRGGGRKADPDRTSRRREDRGVDADHLALQIEQRTSRIALVDRGVGLKEVVIRAAVDVAVAG